MECRHELYVILGNGVKQCFSTCKKLLVPERLKQDYDYPGYREKIVILREEKGGKDGECTNEGRK